MFRALCSVTILACLFCTVNAQRRPADAAQQTGESIIKGAGERHPSRSDSADAANKIGESIIRGAGERNSARSDSADAASKTGESIINGRRAPSMREQFGDYDSFADVRPPSPYGHYYDIYHSLGRRNLSDVQAMSKVKKDLNRTMPVRAIGRDGQSVTAGNRFTLSIGGYFQNDVEIIEVTETSFTLRALSGHSLQGTVTVEIFKDSSGELWLRHEGRGVANEHPMLQRRAYGAAGLMWPEMADNVIRILSEP